MGSVYLALDPRIGRQVAIKTLHGQFSSNSDLLARFFQEARASGKLQHPNIVTIYDLDQTDDFPYIVMEYLDGQPLSTIITQRAPLRLVHKVRYILEICRGLQYAHNRGVIHRDIKPSNIFITADDEVKILDFGIARFTEFSESRTRTRSGAIIGTLGYVSPERVRGQSAADPASDIWAVGITAYELISYQPPFQGDTDYQLFQNIIAGEPTPLHELVPDCPLELEKIIARMLRKDPSERFQTMDELIPELEVVYRKIVDDSIKMLLKTGNEKLGANNTTEAVTAFREILQIDSTHSDAKKLLKQIQPSPVGTPDFSLNPPSPAAATTRSKTTSTLGPPEAAFSPASPGVTSLNVLPAPTGFFGEADLSRTGFFEGNKDRYNEIQETLSFYRKHLNTEYQSLSNQAKWTYYLWLTSVILGLGCLVAGVVLLLQQHFAAGSVSAISTTFVYFIQRVFQQREDHYRTLAAAKREHLEYGNHWLLTIQSIDAIENPFERQRRQGDLVDALTNKLSTPAAKSRKKTAPKKQPDAFHP